MIRTLVVGPASECWSIMRLMNTTAIITTGVGAVCLLVSIYFYVVGVQLAMITAETGGRVSADIHAWQILMPAGVGFTLSCVSARFFYVRRRPRAQFHDA